MGKGYGDKRMEKQYKQDEIVACGMTMRDIDEKITQLSKHTDYNRPSDDFLKVINDGHKALLNHESYGKTSQ